jgi:hypothetical protein
VWTGLPLQLFMLVEMLRTCVATVLITEAMEMVQPLPGQGIISNQAMSITMTRIQQHQGTDIIMRMTRTCCVTALSVLHLPSASTVDVNQTGIITIQENIQPADIHHVNDN